MRNRRVFFAALATACAALVSAFGAPQQKPAEPAPVAKPDAPIAEEPGAKAVREALGAFAKAYSKADVEALTGLLTDDASVVDSNGDEVRGKAAVVEMYADALKDAPGVKLEAQVEDIRFLT